MKNLLIISVALLVCFSVKGQSQDSIRNEINSFEKLVQNGEYQTAVNIAEKLFPELKLTLDEYKIITIENMVVSGDKYEGPEIWRITFKLKVLFGEDGIMGKGGEVFIKVNLKTKVATLIGYGE